MADHWGYNEHNGPSEWYKNYPIAVTGKRQSPINIETKSCNFDPDLVATPLEVSYKPEVNMAVVNNGHSIQVAIGSNESVIIGGPLQGTYRLKQFHLHWGGEEGRGSEHTIDGKSYDAELHLVHWDSAKYSSFTEASSKEDGLAVFGFLIKIGTCNGDLSAIIETIPCIRDTINVAAVIDRFDPSGFTKDVSKYYTYKGSLTTPPLYESVLWIVFDQIMEITPDQINQLRTLKTEDKSSIVDNFRPPQNIGDDGSTIHRVVRRSFQ